MNRLIFLSFFTLCFVFTSVRGVQEYSEINSLNEEENSLIIHRNRRSIIDLIKQSINNTINDLKARSDELNHVLTNLTNILHNTVTESLDRLNNSTQDLLTAIQNAVSDAVLAINTVSVTISECIQNQQYLAEGIVNDTIDSATSCINSTALDILQIINNGSVLVKEAAQMAIDLTNKMDDCFLYNNTLFQLVPCLVSVVNVSETVSLLNKITAHIGLSFLNIVSTPVRVPICLGSSLGNATLQVGAYVVAISQCVFN